MPLSPAFIETARTMQFTNGSDIDNYFTHTGGAAFIGWFNSRVAGKGDWLLTGSAMPLSIATDAAACEYFSGLWSPASIGNIFGTTAVSLLQFAALQSIIINETGGSLAPRTEIVGSPGHPGIAYAFDAIPGLKRSYNTLSSNKNCLLLFNDPAYNGAFSELPLGRQLMNTTDTVWKGDVYPQQTLPTSTLPAVTGYVLEADFFKFRGRGFIQTTGRMNYTRLIQYITAYTGSHPVLTAMKEKWNSHGVTADVLASISTNADWDELFGDTDCQVAAKAIAIHNRASGQYLENLEQAGEDTIARLLYNMGLHISGADSYAMLFQNRVLQLLEQVAKAAS
ncbi:MAG: hypothetical protein ABW019_18380 [Chitinophagaceae bacterium]